MSKILIVLLLSLSWLIIDPAQARDRRDHERARAAVEAGQRMPLSEILRQVEARFGGRVLEIELDHEDDGPVYEIELLDDQGRVLELEIDAVTGVILDQEYDD